MKAVLFFQDNNTPLTKVGIEDLVQILVLSMSGEAQGHIGVLNGRPTPNWLDGFIRRNDLQYKPVQVLEVERIQALTPSKISRHIHSSRVDDMVLYFEVHARSRVGCPGTCAFPDYRVGLTHE